MPSAEPLNSEGRHIEIDVNKIYDDMMKVFPVIESIKSQVESSHDELKSEIGSLSEKIDLVSFRVGEIERVDSAQNKHKRDSSEKDIFTQRAEFVKRELPSVLRRMKTAMGAEVSRILGEDISDVDDDLSKNDVPGAIGRLENIYSNYIDCEWFRGTATHIKGFIASYDGYEKKRRSEIERERQLKIQEDTIKSGNRWFVSAIIVSAVVILIAIYCIAKDRYVAGAISAVSASMTLIIGLKARDTNGVQKIAN